MNTTLSILFYTKKAKTNSDGLVPVYIRVTISGQRFEISTRRYVEISQWSVGAGRVKPLIKTEEAKTLNAFLDSLKNRVYEFQRQIVQEGLTFNMPTFKAKWLGLSERPRMLLEIFQHHNDQMQKLVETGESAPATLERYKTALMHAQSFIKWKFKTSDIDVCSLNMEFVSDYDFWLKSVRRCCHNTSMKYIGQLKKITNLCIRNGWLQRDPFLSFKLAQKEVKKEFLTELEMETIQKKVFTSFRINQVRDIFLFYCYTGLAYIDVKKLSRSEITVGIDGKKWVSIHRQKTDTPSRIPLLPPALEILDKYQADPRCQYEGRLLPVSSNQKMNAYLKEIGDICGIQKKITFHMARFTFGTTVTLGNGVPIETVSKMLGHKSLEQTQHYAKVLDQKVSQDMQSLHNKFKVTPSITNHEKTGS